MSLVSDNIVIGTPMVSFEALGILDTEVTLLLTFDEACNDQGNVFLPHVLKMAGIVKSIGEAKQINKQRMASPKFNKKANQNLWRNLDHPEFTIFKIGKKVFCLVVGN